MPNFGDDTSSDDSSYSPPPSLDSDDPEFINVMEKKTLNQLREMCAQREPPVNMDEVKF